MRIGLSHIDPQIAKAMEERLCAPSNQFLRDNIHWGGFNPLPFSWEFHAAGLKVKHKRDPNPDERRAYALRKKRDEEVSKRGFITAFLPLAGGAGAGLLISSMFGAPVIADVAAATAVWLGGLGMGIRWALKATPHRVLQYELTLEEMRAIFPLLTLTRAERVYCDTLLLIGRMEPNQEARRTIRQTLQQLNELLESSRQLEARRQSLLPILGSNVVRELESEQAELERRLEKTTDPVTRQSLQQSVQMCATRLDNARSFEQALERLNAQQEALVHALASAQSALARMQVAPSAETEDAAQEIAETVTQMNQQTYAVEQAVQEVITLRVP